MSELIFEVTQESDGGYCAGCLTLDIFTQGETWDELRRYEDAPRLGWRAWEANL